eukprot:12957730-Alexandrium_andersonii.AAC.1
MLRCAPPQRPPEAAAAPSRLEKRLASANPLGHSYRAEGAPVLKVRCELSRGAAWGAEGAPVPKVRCELSR